jgi:hypothetical protein
MSPPDESNDRRAIDDLVGAFFRLFSNRGGVTPNLRAIFDLCIPDAVISRCVLPAPEVMALDAFIAPRQELLTSGTLNDFEEIETASRTSIFGNIAQRACIYTKAGVLDGVPFRTRGVKVFQFIKGPHGWRISAVSWDDEREGFTITEEDLRCW